MPSTLCSPQPLTPAAPKPASDLSSLLGNKNRFQFLQQNLNNEQGPLRGSGQSGDDYSYRAPGDGNDGNDGYGLGGNFGNPFGPPNGIGYEYLPPAEPSRLYLPTA